MYAFLSLQMGEPWRKEKSEEKRGQVGAEDKNVAKHRTSAQCCQSICQGLILKEAQTYKIQTFNPHVRDRCQPSLQTSG